MRAADSVVRFGGDEFMLLLPQTDQIRASLVAERLRKDVAKLSLPIGGRVTVSAGVASLPQDATTADALEDKADRALYWAKQNGKNLCASASEVVVSSGSSPPEEHADGEPPGVAVSEASAGEKRQAPRHRGQ